jgi:hypothetical protein
MARLTELLPFIKRPLITVPPMAFVTRSDLTIAAAQAGSSLHPANNRGTSVPRRWYPPPQISPQDMMWPHSQMIYPLSSPHSALSTSPMSQKDCPPLAWDFSCLHQLKCLIGFFHVMELLPIPQRYGSLSAPLKIGFVAPANYPPTQLFSRKFRVCR